MSGIMQMQMAHKHVSGGAGTMRSLLSTAGQTAYDGAANDAWFSVSSTDYAAVLAGLSGTSAIGMSDAQVTVASTTAFSGPLGVTLPQANSTVPSGNYIFGLVVRGAAGASAGTFRPYSSTTFKGTYTVLGSNTLSLAAVSTPQYYLRKNPVSATAATTYVAIGPRTVSNWGATGSWPAAGAYSATMAAGSWTNYTSVLPIQQWLISATYP